MADITATLTPSDEIVVTKFAELPANFTLTQLNDTDITSPADGSYLIFNTSSGNFIDDNTIVKTGTGITLTGSLVVTTNVDVDGTLEADAITVDGTQLSEFISDTVGAMVGSNTESGIAVTYQDGDNTLDFDVADFSITLTGDIAGSGTVTNLGNVSFATTIQANSVALGTDTTGDYVGTITGGTGIDSTAATSGEGTTHTLSVDLNELGTETSIAQADFIAMVDATDDGSGKITFSHLEDTIFGNVSGDIAIAAGGAATIQATSVENSMLAGAIPNSKLANSSVSFGGISVALGASDATPAFDLQDATGYPTSSLVGTITNAQLAGTITNAKLQNSTITVSDGSNTSPVALGGTLTFAGTSNEVTVAESSGTVTIGLPNDIAITGELEGGSLDINGNADISGNLVLGGNLTVSGTTTTVSTTNTTVSDKLLELGTGTTGSASGDAGIIIERGDDANAFIGFDESADKFIVGTGTFTGASTGNLTITTGTLVSNLEGNVTGALTGNADTATTLATARDIGGVSFNGSASINLPGVNTAGNQDTSGTAALATTVTVSDSTANTNFPVVFNNESNGLLDDTGTFIYNPSTGLVSATGFSGALTGTLQTAAQANITSVGTLTSLTAGQITSNATKFELTDTTDSASAGPAIELFRNGGNGSDDDGLGIIRFYGNDSGGNKTEFANIHAEILESDHFSEMGKLKFGLMDATNGVRNDVMTLSPSGVLAINEVSPSAGSGPRIQLIRDNSNSSDEDEIGSIEFKANDDAGNITTYAEIYSEIADASNTAESGEIRFRTITAGASIDPMLTLSGAGSTLTSSLTLGATSTTVGGKILFKEGTDGGTNTVSLVGPATTADVTVTLPNATGTLALTSDVAGTTLTQAAQTNITSLGSLTALDVNGDADISGDLTLSAGGDGALTFGAASSIKVIDNSATALVIEEANTAYMTFNTADSGGEKIEFGKPIHGNLTGNVTGNADTATVATGTLTDHAGANVVEDENTNRSHDIVKTFVGKTFVYTASGHIELGVPDVGVDISIGEQIHFINASSGSTSRIKLDLDESGTAQVITTCTGGGLTASGTTNPEIHQGGVATLIATSDNNYVMFGSGIINA